jgi:hypothetical protein
MLNGLVVGKIVQQDGAKNRTLGFHIGRQAVREIVVGSCHGSYDLERELASKKRDGDTMPRALVDVGQCLRKTENKSNFFGRIRARPV